MLRKYKLILLVILILGVFIVPSNFYKDITKNVVDQIKYRGALVTGEITVDNGDGTYDVKINNASSAYKNVETVTYGAVFSVGEIVVIGYEYGSKESPKILGSAKKIPQEPKQVEVDYSGGCAGVQTKTVTLYATGNSGTIDTTDTDYAKCHDSVDGSDLKGILAFTDELYIDNSFNWEWVDPDYYGIERGYVYFDTSSIPTGTTITSAILSLYCSEKDIDVAFNVVIQDGQPDYPSSILTEADYYYMYYVNNGGQKNTSDFTLNAYGDIPLNANGKNWINKGGMTKLCLRSSQDIAKITPLNSNVIVFYGGPGWGAEYAAKLTITYTI